MWDKVYVTVMDTCIRFSKSKKIKNSLCFYRLVYDSFIGVCNPFPSFSTNNKFDPRVCVF